MLSEDERRELLGFVRRAIEDVFAGRASDAGEKHQCEGRLAEPGGAFVTIRIDRQLRGCIGYIESDKPLKSVIAEVAAKAAFEDPRFPPLSLQEFREATLEVSILSPLHKVASIEEIVVGTHGILLELGRHRGLLLPQVATEYGWDRKEFLENTARKAGLPRDAWSDPQAALFVFAAEIVAEGEPHP
jgi:AmmeMemoRadiSam system protein A